MTTPGQQSPLPPPGNPFAPQQPRPYGQPGPYAPPQQPGPYAPPQQQGPYGTPPEQGGAPYPGAPQQQAPYGAPPGQYGVPPQPGPGMPQPAAGHQVCAFCGGGPAARVTVRAHQGILIQMKFRKLPGPMCRTCGTAAHRSMTVATLWQGWWSPLSLFLFTPVTLLWNLVVFFRLRKLTPPVPGQHGRQVAPELPVLRQPMAYIGLIPIGWICYLLLQGMGVA